MSRSGVGRGTTPLGWLTISNIASFHGIAFAVRSPWTKPKTPVNVQAAKLKSLAYTVVDTGSDQPYLWSVCSYL